MEQADRLLEIIEASDYIVFFGGAGVSTESGIPDFRSKDGLYNQHDVRFECYSPEYLLSHDCLVKNPEVFYEFYRQKMDARHCKPNITHRVLAKLERAGKLKGIVTQNIDGLHQKAGSRAVYEVHGTTAVNYCMKCGKKLDADYIFNCRDRIPGCPDCGGQVRPDVVFYGEMLPEKTVGQAACHIRRADCLIVGGTSLTVYPAAGFIHEFSGRHLVCINRESLTNLKLREESDLMIQRSLGDVFGEIDKKLEWI